MDPAIDRTQKREKQIEAPVVLYAVIPGNVYEAIRGIAFQERRSMADVTREALASFLEKREGKVEARQRPSRAKR